MLKKRHKKSFFWLLRGILGPNRHQKVFKRPITHLKTSQEFKFPIKNLPRWLLLPQKCKKWWYAIRAPCVRRPKTLKIKNFKKSSKNFLFFGVFQLSKHPFNIMSCIAWKILLLCKIVVQLSESVESRVQNTGKNFRERASASWLTSIFRRASERANESFYLD